jgi:hypothetical protein
MYAECQAAQREVPNSPFLIGSRVPSAGSRSATLINPQSANARDLYAYHLSPSARPSAGTRRPPHAASGSGSKFTASNQAEIEQAGWRRDLTRSILALLLLDATKIFYDRQNSVRNYVFGITSQIKMRLVDIRLGPSWLDLSVRWNRRGDGGDHVSASPNRHFASAALLTQGSSINNLIDSAHWKDALVPLCKRSQTRRGSLKLDAKRSVTLRIIAVASRAT